MMSTKLWPEVLKSRGIQSNSTAARFAVQGALDSLSWLMAALLTATFIDSPELGFGSAIGLGLFAAGAQLGIGWCTLLYRNRYPYGGVAELRLVALNALVVALVMNLAVIIFTWPGNLPFAVVTFAMATLLMTSTRHMLRALLDRARRPSTGKRVLIVGAGETGAALIRQMTHDKQAQYVPVALVDDDPAKQNLRLGHVRVFGGTSRLNQVVEESRAEGVVIAIADADSQLIRAISDQLEESSTWIRIVPSLSEQVRPTSQISEIRELRVEDLIGRQPVQTELDDIRRYLLGKRVLVTGAGGSIGSELCRQIHALEPAELIMLDRDESALHSLEMSIHGRALMDSPDVVLADIRDGEALRTIFENRRPDIVFHAAALKHLPMLEQYPQEGWKTNVYGTLNVLNAAKAIGVTSFINVSTDKAADPTSVLGKTKRLAERLTSEFADVTGAGYISVRFGNVLGSRGSVLLSFQEQLRNGGPLTVTHPDVTRFFMTIPEACQLVLQAAVIGQKNEALVLDMGDPIKIVDVAYRLMKFSHTACAITYTGLRQGEKLDEDLFTDAERGSPGPHPKISHCVVPPLSVTQLPGYSASLQSIDVAFMKEACTSTVSNARGLGVVNEGQESVLHSVPQKVVHGE